MIAYLSYLPAFIKNEFLFEFVSRNIMIENLFLFPVFDLKLSFSFQRSRKIFERFNPGGMTKKYNKKTFGMHRIQNFK